jgi:Ubiquitin-specific protease C-terminal
LNQSIAEIMTPSYTNPATTIILFEKLDVSIVELETKRSLKVTWTGIHNKEEGTHAFLLPKTSMVHDLADHLGKLVSLSSNGTGKIRIFEISKDGKTQKEFTGSEMIGNIPEPVDLYAEVCSHLRCSYFTYSNLRRKFLERNLRQMTLTKSLECFISRRNCRVPMVFLSNSS